MTLTYSYDGLGNRTGRKAFPTQATGCAAPGGSPTSSESFAYDKASNLLRATNEAREVVLSYDDSGRLGAVTSGSDQTIYNYENGRLESRQDAAGTTDYVYYPSSAGGRLHKIIDPFSGGASYTYTYTNAGHVKTRSDPNGVLHTFNFDSSNRVNSEVVTKGTQTIASFTSKFDDDSNVETRTSTVQGSSDNGQWTFTYDDISRLVRAVGPGGFVAKYAYDGASNRTKVEVTEANALGQPETTTTTTTFNDAARPTGSSDGTIYAHDNAGNLTGIRDGIGTGWNFDYDPWGRQVKATQVVGVTDTTVPNPVVSTYSYDALDRTLSKDKHLVAAGLSSPPILSETYFYAGASDELTQQKTSVLEENQSITATTSYANDLSGAVLATKKTTTPIATPGPLPTPSPVASAVTDVTLRYAGLGPHGDLNYVTDQNGVVEGAYTYDPWGEPRSATATEPSYLGFQGDPTDSETGLVDMGARSYLPQLGRFTTQDPVAGDMASLLTINPYIYGGGNPISTWDPTGMRQELTAPCSCHGNVSSGGGQSSSSSDGSGGDTRTEEAAAQAIQTAHPPLIGDNWHLYNICSDIHCLADQYTYLTEMGYRGNAPNPNSTLGVRIQMAGALVALLAAPELLAAGLARTSGLARWAGPLIGGTGTALQRAVDRASRAISSGTRAASSAAQGARLNTHLRLLEKYGKAGFRELESGRLRYYGNLRPASTSGPMAGQRFVREWDPATGYMRQWFETLDHQGIIRIVRPDLAGKYIHYMFDEYGNFIGSR